MHETFDYVVVGGGAAGSVVASRLAAAGASVLLLEAGGTDKRMDVVVPGLVASVYANCNWRYQIEPDPTRSNAPDVQMAGKVLGGGGSINSCVYVRGNKDDFDGWAALGCEGWDYNSMLPSLRRMETWQGGANAHRGGSGPIHVEVQTDRGAANRAFIEAALQAGHPPTDDYNGANPLGVSYMQLNHRRGRRSQASREYLRRVAPRSRITVLTDAFTNRVLFEGTRAIGVEYQHEGETKQARAREEVVLSAGAYGSPKLLLVSGVGPRADLEQLGVNVVAHVPGVGYNLHDHPAVMQRWHAKEGVRTLNKVGAVEAIVGLGSYLLNGTGFLAMSVCPVQVMTSTQPSMQSPDLQLTFAPVALSRETDESGMFNVQLAKDPGFTGYSIYLHPRSRGRVTLRSSSPADPPRISLHLFENHDDLRDVVTGLKQVREIMAQPAAAAISNGPMMPEANCKTDADWEQYARVTAHTAHHPVGTCKMGVDDMAVVDTSLRVSGVQGLRVVDASIMPKVTSGNTNAPSMLIGERAAELILSRRNSTFEPSKRSA